MPGQTKEEINAQEAAFAEELRALLAEGNLDPRLQEAIIALSNTNNTTLLDLPEGRDIRGVMRTASADAPKPSPAELVQLDAQMRRQFPVPVDWAHNEQTGTTNQYPPQGTGLPGDIIADRGRQTPDHEGVHRLQDNRAMERETGVPRIDEVIEARLGREDIAGQRIIRDLQGDAYDPQYERSAYGLAQGDAYAEGRPDLPEGQQARMNDLAAMLLGLNNDARALRKLYPDGEVPPLPRYGSPAP